MNIQAQIGPKSSKIDANKVPQAIRTAFMNNVGMEPVTWFKMVVNNKQVRYVVAYEKLNNASGKLLSYRDRYDEAGNFTSSSEYRGNGSNNEDLRIYLGTGGVENDVYERFNKLLKEYKLISFEGFTIVPGKQQEKSFGGHRFVLQDKEKQKVVKYFDSNMKEINMTKYPIRLIELEEMDK
ncbi:hypothetical protein AD998_20610 [bacterium 336/3]|nr:hypothetical protein AD998_20610 [bacterium 336/3]